MGFFGGQHTQFGTFRGTAYSIRARQPGVLALAFLPSSGGCLWRFPSRGRLGYTVFSFLSGVIDVAAGFAVNDQGMT